MTTMDGYGFGELLTHLRKQRRISQDTLAKKLDVHRNTVGKWERGICLPESKTIVLELAMQLRLDKRETQHLLVASLTAVSPYWNVPHQRNLFFTGRDDVLEHLHTMLKCEPSIAALTQSYGLYGLGGIGKTQLAIEYAYQHRAEYETVLWVEAETQTTLVSSFVALATLLALPEKMEGDQSKIVAAVLRWLNQHQGWLLIFDNVEDLSLLKPFLPASNQGALLFTTRLQSLGTLAQRVELSPMTMQEGCDFLLARTHRLRQHEENTPFDDQERAVAQEIVAAMGGLPLALEQAGAYIEETGCSFRNYLQLYQQRRKVLLARRGVQITNYPESVATTWSLSFQKVKQANPAAAELLQLCAFLAPDHIPEELFKDGADYWPPLLQKAAADLLTFNQMLEELLTFSLIKRLVEDRMLSLHRLVQVVQIDTMDLEKQRQWAERVVLAANKVLPNNPNDVSTWPHYLRYFDQAQACVTLVRQYMLVSIEAANVLYRVGVYLSERASYAEAEPLYLKALQIQEQQLGPEHLDSAFILNNLAVLYRYQGKYVEAEPLYLKALHIREQQLGSEHLDTASSFNDVAILYRYQGRYAEAEPLYLKALHIRERQSGPEHPDTASILNNLAVLYRYQGKYAEAEPLYLKVLYIREQQQLGAEHPDIIAGLNNLATLYQYQGKYAKAEMLFQRVLTISQQHLGAEHPHTIISLNNLANLYRDQGKYAEAEHLYHQVLSIRERQLGPEHPDTATCLAGLALLYMHEGRYTQSESLYQRALHILTQHLGSQHPATATVMHNFASLWEAQGDMQQAKLLYEQALAVREQNVGHNHPKTQETRTCYVTLLQKLGMYDQAIFR